MALKTDNIFLESVLEFGFRCGTPNHKEGLSIPILSVAIAALMAIFLDLELSALVSKNSLSMVIHQATSALLDHRLSGTGSVDFGLDASTCKKMVKAINKVWIVSSLFALSFLNKNTQHVSPARNSSYIWSKAACFHSNPALSATKVLYSCS